MPCNKPYTAYRSKRGKQPNGKHPIVFKPEEGLPDSELQIPCGQCWACRLEHSRIWAMRNMHEAQLHSNNQYLTLTYDDDNLPHHNSLHKPHLQKFWKRLRKHYDIRYYACGEYGDKTERPHYHAIVYNLPVPDKSNHSMYNGNQLYSSEKIQRLWTHGNVIIGNVTFESCAYVSRYIMKKRKEKTPHELTKQYTRIDKQTGLVRQLLPEYQTMSKGIGKEYYQKYKSDIYQPGTDGRLIIRGGISSKTPIYYDNLFAAESPQNTKRLETIKIARREHAEERAEDNTPARLKIKDSICQNKSNNQLPRPLN